jgi:hypothetical protein
MGPAKASSNGLEDGLATRAAVLIKSLLRTILALDLLEC